MKKLFASFGWLAVLLPFISVAGTNTMLHTINGNYVSNRQIADFQGISTSGSFDVYVTMGQKESVKLEGDQEYMDRIETVVEDGTLKIRTKKNSSNLGWNFSSERVKVYVTAKTINNLTQSGSGTVKVTGPIKNDRLLIKISGSGSMNLAADVESFNIAISGSGKVTVSGTAKNASISISGSGRFNGQNLRTMNTNVKVTGSGDARIYADKALNASVSGSGGIYYAGNASVNLNKSGSGSIRKL